MSSRFPPRGYVARRVPPGRVAEQMLPFGEGGPDVTALSVVQVIAQLNGILKSGMPNIWVRGEISGYKGPSSSGHCFFSLNDEKGGASLHVKVFASDYRRILFTLEEGLLVLARGAPDVYPQRGELSLRLVEIQPSGAGALALAFEQLKARLAGEGLFEASRKRPLPLLPRRIGVVTSRHGAALRDILKVLSSRFPNAHVTIYPVSVQGPAAAAEIARAVAAFSRTRGADVLIVARGGGSKEDLMAFNDERVVRAVAASAIPTISAVGHEVDVTLTDLAADVRAATPSQAAELVVERRDRFESLLNQGEKNLRDLLRRKESNGRTALLRLMPALDAFAARVRFENAGVRAARRDLMASLRRLPASFEEKIFRVDISLRRWPDRIALPFLDARVLQERRAAADRMAARLAGATEKIAVAAGQLEAMSPLRVLARGYSVTYKDGRSTPLTDAAQVAAGDALRIRLARGTVGARATGTRIDDET